MGIYSRKIYYFLLKNEVKLVPLGIPCMLYAFDFFMYVYFYIRKNLDDL